ncbi:proximal sequence element A Pbp49 isoform X2 [Oratosquilla oratoria]|uniref:proximal sequence element A Pbp49 isoform X2 n=1 Tax=Oratosquilla oratoria TaxID=337810 RepID=UPI003F7639C2
MLEDLQDTCAYVAQAQDFDVKIVDTEEDDAYYQKLEEACSIDLLTCDDELQQHETSGSLHQSGRLTNWYAGSFTDGVIPDGAAEKLQVLREQEKELEKRQFISKYNRLRNRLLKYSSTIRMITDSENCPEPVKKLHDNAECLRDVVLNVRIHRPFFKRTHQKKSYNSFPSHSQELLLLGQQKLSELRDAITCINDLAINEDLSTDPMLRHLTYLPNNSDLYPSGFFYINGIFYNDMRDPTAKDYSSVIRSWAQRHEQCGEMKVANMEAVTFNELELRLGYPYLYLHQGNCEHLMVFTDVRLHHRDDVQEISRYPLLRGTATKLSVSCYICGLLMASWLVWGETRLPMPVAHLCDRCLKLFCYDKDGQKINDIKVLPFIDEFRLQQKVIIKKDIGTRL